VHRLIALASCARVASTTARDFTLKTIRRPSNGAPAVENP
jgi:hypothetical protein